MTQLTDTQIELLQAAAADENGASAEGIDGKLSKSLIKHELLISLPVPRGPSRLLITNAGRSAIGLELEPTPPVAPVERPAAAPKADSPSGKLGALVSLLKRPEGATLEQMMDATGWQAHSVRGAMSGSLKKKLGLAITSEKTEGGRVYRIQSGEGA